MLPKNKLASVKPFARLFLIKFIKTKVRFLLKLLSPLQDKNILLQKCEFNVNLHYIFWVIFMKEIRLQELFTLFYRIFLAYFFYQIARFLFWFFNKDLIKIDSVSDYLSISFHGFAFDTTAILYVNALFILLSLVPIVINTKTVSYTHLDVYKRQK